MRKESSLKSFDQPAARIRQHRQADSFPILVVEGPDDELVLQDHLDHTTIFPVDGKRRVLETAELLLSWGIDSFHCLVDVDFDGQPTQARVVTYPARDLEAWLVELGVLDSLLLHHGSAPKLEQCGGSQALVQEFCQQLEPIRNLRGANAVRNLGLSFDNVDLASKVSKETGELSLRTYIAALRQASDDPPSAASLEELSETRFDDEFGPRGRDIACLAGVALRKRAGTLVLAATETELLAKMLRSSAGLAISRTEWINEMVSMLRAQVA